MIPACFLMSSSPTLYLEARNSFISSDVMLPSATREGFGISVANGAVSIALGYTGGPCSRTTCSCCFCFSLAWFLHSSSSCLLLGVTTIDNTPQPSRGGEGGTYFSFVRVLSISSLVSLLCVCDTLLCSAVLCLVRFFFLPAGPVGIGSSFLSLEWDTGLAWECRVAGLMSGTGRAPRSVPPVQCPRMYTYHCRVQ